MTPGTQNYTKFWCFIFLQFSWPRVHFHKNQMLQFSPIMNFHKNQKLQFSLPRLNKISQKSDAEIFSNFHDLGYTKLRKNQMLYFSSIFMTPGTQNFTKIWRFNFLQFSWLFTKIRSFNFMTPGKQNFTKIRCWNFLQVMKIGENWSVRFLCNFVYPLKKNKVSEFCVILCTRVHENWRKIKHLNFV